MKGTLTQGQMFSSNPVLSKLEHVAYKAHLAQKYTIKNMPSGVLCSQH